MIALTNEQINVIKNGYKRVQVTVSFPNGERTAITNDDIVYESLSFNESICTSDIFRFGNAEASSVSFETVGVENILGYTISVKLTYEYQNPEYPHDTLTFDVPYGTFVVTSCPRNHENMTHRRVQAVSRTSDTNDVVLPTVEKDKLRSKVFCDPEEKYTPNVWYLLDSIYGKSVDYTDTTFCTLDSYDTTETKTGQCYINYETVEIDGVTTHYEYYFGYTATLAVSPLCGVHGTSDSMDALYSMKAGYYDTTYVDTIDDYIEQYGLNEAYTDYVKALKNLAAFNIHYGYVVEEDITDAFNYLGIVRLNNIYGNFLSGGFTFRYPLSISLSFYRTANGVVDNIIDFGSFEPYRNLTVTQSIMTNYKFPFYLSVNHTLENEPYTTATSNVLAKSYQFQNAYDISELTTGFAEIRGGFVRTNRDGTGEIITLDDSNPYPLTASDVQGRAWWDEYVVSPVGSVKYIYSDKGGEHEREYVIDADSGSIYDMTDNYFMENVSLNIKKVSSTARMYDPTVYYRYNGYWYAYDGTAFTQMGDYEGVQSILEYFIQTFFVPSLGIIGFVPIDMDIRGLPFLQCGDAITFTAADGTVINSFILNHTFTGIQHITENIDTVQGEVLK